MSGLIGKKIGMTSVYSAEGKNIPCTVIEAGPCVVTQIKTLEKDAYEAVQIAYDDKSEKHTSSSLLGHFKKAGTTPKRKMAEFKDMPEVNLGDTLTVDIFSEEDWVDVTGISKGRGFLGGEQVKVLNLKVLKVIPENNLILVKGSIPGAKGSYLTIEK